MSTNINRLNPIKKTEKGKHVLHKKDMSSIGFLFVSHLAIINLHIHNFPMTSL